MSDTDLIIESEIEESGDGKEMNPYQAIHDFKELTPSVEQPDMPTRQMFEDATTLLNDDENVGVYLGALNDQFLKIAKWTFENPQGLDTGIEGEFINALI
jgi:hypothetical protein